MGQEKRLGRFMAAFAAAEAVRLPNTEALGVHWLGR
jgi:hypothetical protein